MILKYIKHLIKTFRKSFVTYSDYKKEVKYYEDNSKIIEGTDEKGDKTYTLVRIEENILGLDD